MRTQGLWRISWCKLKFCWISPTQTFVQTSRLTHTFGWHLGWYRWRRCWSTAEKQQVLLSAFYRWTRIGSGAVILFAISAELLWMFRGSMFKIIYRLEHLQQPFVNQTASVQLPVSQLLCEEIELSHGEVEFTGNIFGIHIGYWKSAF